ncbi:hypothetical protein GALL_343350 [mine drainage metagenome]|jgi:predicted ATP-dependent protease|uniref:Lon proteolytic domain-containing protein n=1 Tax=mine drainage metagenome TaxID=410659 RepID=A0A1J5QK36_9ZZZZ
MSETRKAAAAPPPALTPEALRARCDPAELAFASSAELDAAVAAVGQQRATEALALALALRAPGYNAFVLGEAGSGRHSVVQTLLAEHARGRAAPDDLCYVNNFAAPAHPALLRVPPGRGRALADDMDAFVAELAKAVPAAFDSDAHQARVEAIQNAYKQREEEALAELGKSAAEAGIALLRNPRGFIFAPLKDGEAMGPQEFSALPADEQERIGALVAEYGKRLEALMQQLPRWRRDAQAQIKEASRETLGLAAGHLLDDVRQRHADLPAVQAFLDAVMHDVLEAGESLRETTEREDGIGALVLSGQIAHNRYRVNALVTHDADGCAPVVVEDHPTHANLVGRIDQVAQLGTLVTNFTLIRPGALHRAHGGYLVLDALKVLGQPYAWDGLKRALAASRVHIETVGQLWGLAGSVALEPQPLELDVKVVLVGERHVYYLLKQLDPDFDALFKIAADFDDDLPRDAETTRLYAAFVATLARDAALPPLSRDAVARMVEHGARLAGDARRLSTNRRQLLDVLREAAHGAGEAAQVDAAHVDAALHARLRRADRVRERLHAAILRDELLISVAGTRIGQVNGLAVIELDDLRFAHPVRISATTRVGDGAVIDIEREAELGGAIHSKGVMILASFLGARYARATPLSLSASLVFEQSYGPVEGDSASLAELCALMSDLAAVPLRQSLAVTGSVNQFGDVQAIGAVNEKIEGFYAICKARGLSGEQGVLIPASNAPQLMLDPEVVDACAAGRFHVWAVRDVDQAIELLTGVTAGAVDSRGRVPLGSINHRVALAVAELSAIRQAFASPMSAQPARRRKRAAPRKPA